MHRYRIIINPTSGRGRGEIVYPVIEQELERLKLDFDICRTEAPGHAVEIARQAAVDGCDIVVAVGGDGTSNEVLNGLMHARNEGYPDAVMGLIGVGRGNDFAYGVHTPADITDACQSLAEHRYIPIDVGFLKGGDFPDGRYFGNGVGIGFDAVVGFEALKLKRLHGFPSYIVAALKTIFLYFKAPTVHIEYNGVEVTQPALMVSIMNGRRLGGGFMMAPEGKIDDGLFDLTIADQVGKMKIFALIFRFMQGSQAGHPAIKMTQTDRVIVSAVDGILPEHADGETICEAGESLALEIVPKALEVIIPGKNIEGNSVP